MHSRFPSPAPIQAELQKLWKLKAQSLSAKEFEKEVQKIKSKEKQERQEQELENLRRLSKALQREATSGEQENNANGSKATQPKHSPQEATKGECVKEGKRDKASAKKENKSGSALDETKNKN